MPPLTFLGPVNTGDTYEAKDGFKKTGFSDTSFLLAGGGTALVSNFATYTNIASTYYTKVQLQTSGQAQVNWGNLTGVPATFPATAHNHDDRYYTETESDTRFVPYTGATTNVNLGDKNIEFAAGSISRVQGASRIFNKVYQSHLSGTSTGILSIKFTQATSAATMFDVTIKCYGYNSKYLGEVRIAFYKSSGTTIQTNGAKAIISGSGNFPVNSVQVGIDGSGKVCINLGTISTAWSSYMSFEVERVETKHTGYNNDWSQGWEHSIETVDPALVAQGGTYQSIVNNASFGTEFNFGHTNKPFLDVINQNLGTTHSPTFNGVTVGYASSGFKGFNSGLPFAFLNASQAQQILTGGVLASNSYGDATKIPAQGIYSKGNILTGGNFVKEGGTASQFLKADGSVDSNVYALNTALGNYMPTTHPANSITTLNITNWNNYFPYIDDRTIAPNELGVQKLRFGFTSWNNNNTSPYADFIHFGGYQDASGGNQNLLLINKGSFGIRQYQATSQSTTPYANFVDYWHTGNFNPANYATATHDHAGVYEPVFTKNTAFNKNFGTVAGTVAQGNHTHNYSDLIGTPTIPQGTVTSVAMTAPTGLSVTGSPITSSGTLALSYATGYQGYTTTEATKLAGIATGADNYGSWNLKTNGVQRVAVTSGGTLDLVAGTNVSLTYGAGGVVTINSTDTNNVYTAGTGIKLTTNVFGQDITTAGTGTFVTGISQTANGFQVNLGTPPNDNTVYTAGTGLSLNGTVFSHPTTAGNKHIPAGGAAGQILRWSADGTAVWGADNNTTYSVFTTNTPGLVPGRVGTTTTKYLREDGTWTVPPDNNTTYSVFTTNVAGLVPARVGATTTRFLREDGTWVIPTDTNTTYSSGTGLVLNGTTFSISQAYIEAISNGDQAWLWGDHSQVGYLTSSSLNGYALANGTNAAGTWATDSNGLYVNGTVGLKTFGPGGVNTSLNDATYGSVAGVINNHGTAVGNPTNNWYHRIKMLHNNPGGYYTEIAVGMDVLGMYYKQFYAGTSLGWVQVLDSSGVQNVTGIKTFRTTGNSAVTDIPLQAYSDNASFPAISFHKAGAFAGSIALVSTQYQFRNLPGTGLLNAKANQFSSDYGFVHDGYVDPNAILTSDGGVAYAEIDILNDAGELRIQPLEITSSGAAINCAVFKHKLVYIRVRSGNKISLSNPQPGQRFILFNVDGYASDVEINSSYAGTLDPYTKISLYITNLGERLFYDKTELYAGVF